MLKRQSDDTILPYSETDYYRFFFALPSISMTLQASGRYQVRININLQYFSRFGEKCLLDIRPASGI